MTDALVAIATFMSSIFLSIQFAGALYGVIDHWYQIGRYWGRVVAAILVWGGLFVGIGYLLKEEGSSAYIAGVWVFLGGHLLVTVLGLTSWRGRAAEEKAYRVYLKEEVG